MENKNVCYRAILHCVDPAGNPYVLTVEETDRDVFYRKLKKARVIVRGVE